MDSSSPGASKSAAPWNRRQSVFSPQSILASQIEGVLTSHVQATPNTFGWKGAEISFKELWIERETKTEYPYIWFYRHKDSGNYILCFTLANGSEAITRSGPFFIINGVSDQSFATLGFNRLFFCEINSKVFLGHNLQVRLTSAFTDPRGQVLQFTW
jgi:hypothetical protein